MTIVGVLEARDNLSALIKRARAGEDIVIASRDVPQVRLVPVSPPPEHGSGTALIAWCDKHPPTRDRSADQIDSGIHTEREAWD